MKLCRILFPFATVFRRAPALLLSAVCAAFFIAPPTAVAQSNLPNLGDTARSGLTPAQERKLGEEVMQIVRRDPDYLDDAPLLEYLNALGNGMVVLYPEARGETGSDFFFFAVRDPAINAFALPGGFIGVHSALVLTAQSESELASVIAHEIGHVAQRHIARMVGQQSQDMLIPIAAAVLAAAAARGNSDAAMGIMTGGLGLAAQRQINFTREAEREADRIGFQILKAGGYDPAGMTVFFNRMQTATRAYSDTTPAYLRTHPVTTERIADIQARIREQRYRQRADSLDFHLAKARLRALQDESTQGLADASLAFENQLAIKTRMQTIAAHYGQALIAYKRGELAKARSLLQQARSEAKDPSASRNIFFASLSIDLRLAAGQRAEAVKEAKQARSALPLSRGIALQYAEALHAAGRLEEAASYLREQVLSYREEPKLYRQLAKTYAAQNKQALTHLSMAHAYAINGSLSSALDQLAIARRSPDATFYDHSLIDAREREWQALRREEIKEGKKPQ
ncbi:MAG: family metallopeptidase [Burkholderiaceae bacterium]|nr:family metallopeptidase [Burkholderiaceae bacterium]